MFGFLVFDHLNDIVFKICQPDFISYMKQIASELDFHESKQSKSTEIDDNVIIQFFCPLVASQRIMGSQFGNFYTSIQCDNGFNICLNEYMGYLFLLIKMEDIYQMERSLQNYISFLGYLCGPDVYIFKNNEKLVKTLALLIENWEKCRTRYECFAAEAIESLAINAELTLSTLTSLKRSVDKIITITKNAKIHSLLFVNEKLLALYSTEKAEPLQSIDIVFLNIFNTISIRSSSLEEYRLFLSSSKINGKCVPHLVYFVPLAPHIKLVYIVQNTNNIELSTNLFQSFFYINAIQTSKISYDYEMLRTIYYQLEDSFKCLFECLKKSKSVQTKKNNSILVKKFQTIKNSYLDFFKNGGEELLLRAETLCADITDTLKNVFNSYSFDINSNSVKKSSIKEVSRIVLNTVLNYSSFVLTKALRNINCESYLIEFPGMLYFMLVDRNSYKMCTSSLGKNPEDTKNSSPISMAKITRALNFARRQIKNDHLSFLWKDSALNYGYFLWFKDVNGMPLKQNNSFVRLPNESLIYNSICEDLYVNIKGLHYPKIPPVSIKCYELLCIHFGVVTNSLVLEHVRRLVAIIDESKSDQIYNLL